jgi:organic hydroperoxide reductase OsmC/OhrA
MHMRDQKERRFSVNLTHQRNYQFLSQATEDGRLHGAPYISDEPDPVGDDAGPSTPAMLATALGHCLSAALIEALRKSEVAVLGCDTQAVAVVQPNADGHPRIHHVDVTLRPRVEQRRSQMQRCEEIFQNHCTVTSSVRQGIDVRVQVDWQIERETATVGST